MKAVRLQGPSAPAIVDKQGSDDLTAQRAADKALVPLAGSSGDKFQAAGAELGLSEDVLAALDPEMMQFFATSAAK